MASTGAQTSFSRSRYDANSSGDSWSRANRSRYVARSSGVSDGMSRSRGTLATADSSARHRASGSVSEVAPARWARTCISVKHVSSDPSPQKPRTTSARSSRPLNISASCGYRACIEGRAATERSHERSQANEGAAVTDGRVWGSGLLS